MPRFNNRANAGQPTRPYRDNLVNAGSDCWLELTFLDRFGNAATPTGVTIRIDNLTDVLTILQTSPVTPPTAPANTLEINIPASTNQMSYNWRGTQLNQVTIAATYSDGSQIQQVFVYELCAIATVGGA